MSAYTYIKAIASALQASTAIKNWCVANYGRGCLVRIDDYPASPLSSADAPWICVAKVPQQELGQVADKDGWELQIIAGLCAGDLTAIPALTTERTASVNGLEQVGDAEKAEDLLALALAVVRGLTLANGTYIDKIVEDSDGWSELPLQTSAAQITLRRERTMGES